MECPNFSSLESRAFREGWEDLRPEQHVHHFTPQALRRLVLSAKFQPVRLDTQTAPSWHVRDAVQYVTLPWIYCRQGQADPGPSRALTPNRHPQSSRSTGSRMLARLRSVEVFASGATEMRDMHVEPMLRGLQQAAILRAVYSRHQLRERLVDFWTNHFNIYARKGDGTYFLPTDQLKVIRPHALGKFPDIKMLSSDQYAEIERIATAKKVSVAWVVREAIDGYIGAQWPLLESKGT